MKTSIQPFTTNETLNPVLWEDFKLKPLVRFKLLTIAKDFINTLKVANLNLQDITISGSNAGYGYSKYSDIDLHLVVDVDDEELEDYYNSKKTLYNIKYNITVKDIPVEVYVQKSSQPHYSAGIYSILDDEWIQTPPNKLPKVDGIKIKQKAKDYAARIKKALKSNDLAFANETLDNISRLRKAGLEAGGETSVENYAFKLIRSKVLIDKLRKYTNKLHSDELSLKEYMKIYEILGEEEHEKVTSIAGDKATLTTPDNKTRQVDAKSLTPDPSHPGQFTIPPTDPSTITPGAIVSQTTESSEEEEEELDLISPYGNRGIGGKTDPAQSLINDIIDKDFERNSGRGSDDSEDAYEFSRHKRNSRALGNRSPISETDKELSRWLTIAGLR